MSISPDRDNESTPSFQYTVYTIRILALTNIPGAKDALPITFASLTDGTRTIGEYSAHPFFTDAVAYPYTALSQLTRREMLAFFFHEKTFTTTIETHVKSGAATGEEQIYCHEIEKYKIKDGGSNSDPLLNTAICNIWCMIRLFFSTEFPETCNVLSSFLNYIKSLPILKNSFSTNPIINMAMFIPTIPANARLSINGSTYTVAKTVWLDDIVNHPIYAKLVSEYAFLLKWCANTKPANEKTSELLKKKINAILKLLGENDNNIMDENAAFMKPSQNTGAMIYGDHTNAANYVVDKIKLVFGNKGGEILQSSAKTFNDIVDKVILAATELVNESHGISAGLTKPAAASSSGETIRASVDFEVENTALDDIFQKLKTSGRTTLSTRMNKILTQLHQYIQQYRILVYINKTYLSGTINSGFKTDTNLSPALMESAGIPKPFYPEYVAFMETIRKVVIAAENRPIMNDALGQIFVSFIDETDNEHSDASTNFNACMKIASELLDNTAFVPKFSFDKLYVGMNRLPFAHESGADFELYLSMDLIGNVFTAKNRASTECRYKDASIGDYIENTATANPNLARPASFFVDTETGLAPDSDAALVGSPVPPPVRSRRA